MASQFKGIGKNAMWAVMTVVVGIDVPGQIFREIVVGAALFSFRETFITSCKKHLF
ncbi:hypothetical protein MTR_1g113890 [Medicago truncatula]|uniref:Uncharacterized protein n=1 Tax=Medicago truncatula TaxID=3880 RepID=G7IDC6_MEDTR|nr:hypothetical protein MTR_1g113890 [Medicago truncatula]